ncbi:MAG: c-type cytochrome [Gammaproteobacteria bacterium]|nr:c-type cytochrome [Gammaproteobacteria bacterium]MBU1416066.1 c-type cytochrome [Gammaproteobacteria bacterium]
MLSKNYRSCALASVIAMTASVAFAMGGSPAEDSDATAARIQPVARLQMAPLPTDKGTATPRTGEQLYKAICFACHAPGAAIPTSPKIGDKAAWAPRIGVGLDVLTKTAISGKNAMPPKGGAMDASETEIARAIVYMTNKSGANFHEPAAGAKIASGDRTPEQIAQSACLKCHETGEQGAPKLSDKAAWSQRTSKGLDAVTKTVIRGHGNMPARGGLADLTDAELKSVIAYLLKRVGSGG